MKITFIADFFLENGLLGGAELCNNELVKKLRLNHEVFTIQSVFFNKIIDSNKPSDLYIVSNRMNMTPEGKEVLSKKRYFLYEHDQAWNKNRDPSIYDDFVVPKSELKDLELYQGAEKIFCQSKLHQEVLEKNLNLGTSINLGGNLWPKKDLDYIQSLNENNSNKEDLFSVLYSLNPIKNFSEALRYAKVKKIPYKILPQMMHHDFLRELSKNKGLIFFPKVLETFNRVVVEARMMGCDVITNSKLLGCTSEPWFRELKGSDLVEFMRTKQEEIMSTIERTLHENHNYSS